MSQQHANKSGKFERKQFQEYYLKIYYSRTDL